jgi:hypothetical protein
MTKDNIIIRCQSEYAMHSPNVLDNYVGPGIYQWREFGSSGGHLQRISFLSEVKVTQDTLEDMRAAQAKLLANIKGLTRLYWVQEIENEKLHEKIFQLENAGKK